MVSASAGWKRRLQACRIFCPEHNFIQRERSERFCIQRVCFRALADHDHLGVGMRHPHGSNPISANGDAELIGDSGKNFQSVRCQFM